ncbi:DUF4386 domain-containing protein [Amphritea pacifica]|uniref:DUF4386 domain-containing protein n=1 Tax=Amphritea pacifica TaxID=2811233 RepID=UPI0019666CFF|nr:DUF4386 domain-containing protein [Amphritea pacifica]MBN1006533.1 DUF4386 domain-containing protein [Amphritea pacifica]
MNTVNEIRLARLAGCLYLLLIPMGVFGIMYIPELITVAGDNSATLANLTDHATTIRLSILCAFAIQLTQLFLVIALYYLLRPYGVIAARFMVLFTLVTIPIALLNELSHITALLLSESDLLREVFNPQQLDALTLFLLELHRQGIMIAHIFWGLWLMPMGYLVYRCGFLPRVIGVLLIIAGIGYCLDTITFFALATDRYLIAQYTFPGEVLLPLSLLWKAYRAEKRIVSDFNQGSE